jgi:hypothetical protein
MPSFKTLGVASSRNLGYGGKGRPQGPTPTISASFTGQASSTTASSVSSVTCPAYGVVLVCAGAEVTTLTSIGISSISYGGLTFTKRTAQTFAGHFGTSNQTLEIWYAINNSASSISAATLSITYNATFDDQSVVVASVSGCYMPAPWSTVGPYVNYQLNGTATQATNTYSTSLSNSLAIEFHGTNDPNALAYVTTSGWTGVNFIQNGGASYWEYVYLSSQGFTSLQTNQTTTTNSSTAPSWISIVDSLVS